MRLKQLLKISLVAAVLLSVLTASTPNKAQAASASFHLSPASSQAKVGTTVSARILVSTDTAINAGEGSVSFSSNILEYQSVSTSGSIFTFWPSGPTGTATGITFSGGLSNPGYTGSSGTVLTITWKAKAEGTATITVSGSKILANDGVGTNIYGGSTGGTIIVSSNTSSGTAQTPSQTTTVTSSSHPDQNAWYNQKKAALSWSAKSAQGYSFSIDQSATTTPSAPMVTTTKNSFDIASDGIWYFHIRAKFASGFGPVTHFKIQVDTVSPEPFTVTINQEGGTKNPMPNITFEAKDVTSGIDRYEGIIDSGTPFAINPGDKLPKQRPGNHSLMIRAFDKAGNTGNSQPSNFHIDGVPAPKILRWDKIVGLLQPIHFIGESGPDDTIIIVLSDVEVARFKASDYKTTENPTDPDTQIIWDYPLIKTLMAGEYNFRIGLIDKNEAESELTNPLKVKVVPSYITIWGHIIPTIYILILLLFIIVILIMIIILLVKKLHKLAKSDRGPIGLVYTKISQLFSKTEKEIDYKIDNTIPENDLSKGAIKEIKKDLKEKIHEEIKEAETDLKNTEDN